MVRNSKRIFKRLGRIPVEREVIQRDLYDWTPDDMRAAQYWKFMMYFDDSFINQWRSIKRRLRKG